MYASASSEVKNAGIQPVATVMETKKWRPLPRLWQSAFHVARIPIHYKALTIFPPNLLYLGRL